MANPRHHIVRVSVDPSTGACHLRFVQVHYFDDGRPAFVSDELMRFLSDLRLLGLDPNQTVRSLAAELTNQSRFKSEPETLCHETIDRARRSSNAAIRAAANGKGKFVPDTKPSRQPTHSTRPRRAGNFERLVQRNQGLAQLLQHHVNQLRQGGRRIPIGELHWHFVEMLVRSGVRDGEYPFNTRDRGLRALGRWLKQAEDAEAGVWR
jgi:hypothetical protein